MRVKLIGLSLALATLASVARAQQGENRLGATLRGWDEYARLTIFDRTGSYFGRTSAQGILQRFGSSELDVEYDLDVVSFSPSLAAEREWFRHQSGARFWTGSINHMHLIQYA